MSNFLSGVAVLLSTLALLFGGFSTYKIFTLEQKIDTAINTASGGTNSLGSASSNSVNTTPPANQFNSPNSTANPVPVAPTADNANTQATSSAGVQPGQFIQPAFTNTGQVELLAVKRIKDPQTGRGDIVNVQFRIRRQTEKIQPGPVLFASNTTARNPETSETYKPADAANHATNAPIFLGNIPIGSSVDAYVWMRIPEEVNTVDLLFENTQAFKNIPISS